MLNFCLCFFMLCNSLFTLKCIKKPAVSENVFQVFMLFRIHNKMNRKEYSKVNLILLNFTDKTHNLKWLISQSLSYDSRQLNGSRIQHILINFMKPDTVKQHATQNGHIALIRQKKEGFIFLQLLVLISNQGCIFS